jgi:transposase-like protein
VGIKGDKATKLPAARQLYLQGRDIPEISGLLEISENTLRQWRKEDTKPGAEMSEWDRLRQQKKDNIARMRNLVEEQMTYLEGLNPAQRSSGLWDGIAKAQATLERMEKFEKAREVADQVATTARKAGLSAEAVEEIKRSILGIAA